MERCICSFCYKHTETLIQLHTQTADNFLCASCYEKIETILSYAKCVGLEKLYSLVTKSGYVEYVKAFSPKAKDI